MGKVRNRLKFALIIALVMMLIFVAGIFVVYRYFMSQPEKIIETIQEHASVVLDKIHQESVRDGVKEWELTAEAARLEKGEQWLELDHLLLTYYPQGYPEVRLTADKGSLNTTTKDIHVEGHVHIQWDAYELRTDDLQLNNKEQIIRGLKPVKVIASSGSELAADSLKVDIGRQIIIFHGHVQGVFSETIIP